MDTTTRAPERRIARPLALLASLSALGLAFSLMAAPVLGARTVVPFNSGNPTCSDFDDTYGGGSTWTELKLEDKSNEGGANQLQNGTYTDGTLIVTISNFVNSSSGTPGSFDWSANIGVDAVFVKAGTDKHNLFVYNPEALSDTGLGPQAGQGNGISHISFCYDTGDATPTPTPTASPTPTQPATPTPTASPTPSPEQSVQGATGTPEQSVLAATGTPAQTTVPDTATGVFGVPSSLPTIFFGLVLLASLGTLAWVNVEAARRRG